MHNTKRFVNIRGYVREVTVLHKIVSSGEWIVKDGKTAERVHEENFYHKNSGGLLVGRGSEFSRKYPGHPVEEEQLPPL